MLYIGRKYSIKIGIFVLFEITLLGIMSLQKW